MMAPDPRGGLLDLAAPLRTVHHRHQRIQQDDPGAGEMKWSTASKTILSADEPDGPTGLPAAKNHSDPSDYHPAIKHVQSTVG